MTGLDQLDRLDHDRNRAAQVGRADRSLEQIRDGGVDDRLELGEANRVGEHEAAQGGAIERAVGSAILRTEAHDDRVGDRRPGRHDLACEVVGIDHGGAASRQPACHGRLAAADRADQANQRGAGSEGVTTRGAHGAASSISSQASSAAARA